MAKSNVSETDTVEAMIYASQEFAANLIEIRNRWVKIDPAMANLIEGLRIQFASFASAASSGLVSDPVTLHVLGKVYQDAAVAVHEIFEAGMEGRGARSAIAKVSGLSVLIVDLIEKGPRSVVRGSGPVGEA